MLQTIRPLLPWICLLLGVWAVGTGCTSDAALQRLSPPEQAEFFLYRNAMTGTQEHAYLAKATAAERTAYLSEIGLAQRFQALDAFDQEAIRSGVPRVGMSADALLFLWGNPTTQRVMPAGQRTGIISAPRWTWGRVAISTARVGIAWMSISSGARSRGGWRCSRVVASGRAAARVATKGACLWGSPQHQ